MKKKRIFFTESDQIGKHHQPIDRRLLSETGVLRKMAGGGNVVEVAGEVVNIGDTVMIKAKGFPKGKMVKITNITDKWVIFTDLTDNKRKDNARDLFLKNFLSKVTTVQSNALELNATAKEWYDLLKEGEFYDRMTKEALEVTNVIKGSDDLFQVEMINKLNRVFSHTYHAWQLRAWIKDPGSQIIGSLEWRKKKTVPTQVISPYLARLEEKLMKGYIIDHDPSNRDEYKIKAVKWDIDKLKFVLNVKSLKDGSETTVSFDKDKVENLLQGKREQEFEWRDGIKGEKKDKKEQVEKIVSEFKKGKFALDGELLEIKKVEIDSEGNCKLTTHGAKLSSQNTYSFTWEQIVRLFTQEVMTDQSMRVWQFTPFNPKGFSGSKKEQIEKIISELEKGKLSLNGDLLQILDREAHNDEKISLKVIGPKTKEGTFFFEYDSLIQLFTKGQWVAPNGNEWDFISSEDHKIDEIINLVDSMSSDNLVGKRIAVAYGYEPLMYAKITAVIDTTIVYEYEENGAEATKSLTEAMLKQLSNGETITIAGYEIKLAKEQENPSQTGVEIVKVYSDENEVRSERDLLLDEYNDILYLISVTPFTDTDNMLALKQQSKELKEKLDTLDLELKKKIEGETKLLDNLFKSSVVKPQERYELKPYIDGFAPNGDPTHLPKNIYEWTLSEQFIDWFGHFTIAYNYKNSAYQNTPCSVVVSKNYEPLIVYHGTGVEFSFFKFDKFPAMYFAENPDYSNWFAEMKGREMGTKGYVYPFFLNIRTPLDLTHFEIQDVSPQDFIDWMFLQTGLDEEELKINKALLNPNGKYKAWMFLRNSPEMLKVLRDKNVCDGIIYYEDNPSVDRTSSAYQTKAYIVFNSNSAKIADPLRDKLTISAMRSFYLKKGGKI